MARAECLPLVPIICGSVGHPPLLQGSKHPAQTPRARYYVNRETKRMLQRQGQLGQDGNPAAAPRQPQQRASLSSRSSNAPRQSPLGYLREIRNELRKVNWPSRTELRNYSIVVLITLFVMIGLIFVLDYLFSEAAVFLFK